MSERRGDQKTQTMSACLGERVQHWIDRLSSSALRFGSLSTVYAYSCFEPSLPKVLTKKSFLQWQMVQQKFQLCGYLAPGPTCSSVRSLTVRLPESLSFLVLSADV
jgi:hypothetical protein